MVKSTINRAPVAKTGDIFCAREQFQRHVAEVEAGRILREHLDAFLIPICVDYSCKFDDAFLVVNSGLCEFVSERYFMRGSCNQLRGNKIISFCDVVMVLIRINTQMRFTIRHDKEHTPVEKDCSRLAIINCRDETTA